MWTMCQCKSWQRSGSMSRLTLRMNIKPVEIRKDEDNFVKDILIEIKKHIKDYLVKENKNTDYYFYMYM